VEQVFAVVATQNGCTYGAFFDINAAARVSGPVSRVQAIDNRGSDTAEAALRCSSMQG